MKFIGRLFLVSMMAIALLRAATAEPSGLTTARLEIDGAVCSGTIVGQSTILSAAHCFKDEDPLEDFLGHTAPAPTRVLVDGYSMFIIAIVTDGADHALVKVDFIFKGWAVLGPQPKVGEHVRYWGNPAAANNIYREGYVTSFEHGDMLLDVNGFFGDSGAGIFDESGHVIGVMSYIKPKAHMGIVFRLMGVKPFEFTPLQYSLTGVTPP